MKHIALALLISLSVSAQTIRTSGSNVDLLDAEWASVVAKKTGTAGEQAQYAALQSYIANYCPSTVTVGASKQGCHLPMALAYKMDSTTYGGASANKACLLLKYYVDRQDGDAGGYLDTDGELNSTDYFRWGGPVVASSWSILKTHCDAYDTSVGDRVRETVSRAWEILKPDTTYPNGRFAIIKTPYQVNGNSGLGQVLAMTKLAAATYDASTYTAPQTTWLPYIKTAIMDAYVVPCLVNDTAASNLESCYGGSWGEGMSEYGPESIKMMMELIEAWRVGTTDSDYWASVSGVFPGRAADWVLHATSPTGAAGTYYTLYQPFLYRDVQAGNGQYYGYMYFVWRQMVNRMQAHLERSGDTTRADYLQWWMKNIQPAYWVTKAPASENVGFEWDMLLYDDPDSAGTDYRSVIGTDDITPYMLLTRSDWTANATWAGFLAMQEGGSHQHADTGTFNIYRKGKWLTREIPGYFSARNNMTSSLHNNLTLNGHGAFTVVRQGTISGTARLQRRTGGYMATCNDVYCSAQADLSPSYKFSGYLISSDVNTATRDFFHLKANDIFVVSDRIKYSTGVTAPSIFHVQSEKGAATISGDLATISNASQRLHVTKVFPSTADFYTPSLSTCKVIDIRIRSNDQAAFFFDCAGLPTGTPSITLSGFTGDYAVLNGARTFSVQSGQSGAEPFSDGVSYNGERLLLTSAGLFIGLAAYDPATHGYGTTSLTRSVQWNDPDINPTAPGTLVTHNPYRLDIHSGRRVNEESFLVVMQGADSTDTAMTVSALTSTTSNATGAAFTPPGGSLTEVIAPTLTTPTFPMSITRTGDPATHYVFGMTPGSTYKIRDALGVTTIDTTGSGTSVVANNAGILTYSVDTGVASPTITLVATPSSLTASCVNGGSNPADQTIDLTVTGDGGEAAISFSDDSSAISETLSGGAAPQNTPQTMTVAFGGCSGLSVGTHNLTISVTSGTTYVVNSPLTIPATVTVAADPLIAASPASVNFTATVSGANPADQTVTISRTVSGDLGTITEDSAGGWLTVSPTTATGITSQDLTLSVDIAGLSAGQHTATITIPSTGASNTPLTVPVLLAIDPPPQIGIEPKTTVNEAIIRYTAPSRSACTVRACTDATCASVVATGSDGGGFPSRTYTITGLTAATSYVAQTVCGDEIRARAFTTRASGGPTVTFPIDKFNAYDADNILVEYGATDSLTETPIEGTCSGSRCTAMITWANANRILYYRIKFRDSGDNVLWTEAIVATSLR